MKNILEIQTNLEETKTIAINLSFENQLMIILVNQYLHRKINFGMEDLILVLNVIQMNKPNYIRILKTWKILELIVGKWNERKSGNQTYGKWAFISRVNH